MAKMAVIKKYKNWNIDFDKFMFALPLNISYLWVPGFRDKSLY